MAKNVCATPLTNRGVVPYMKSQEFVDISNKNNDLLQFVLFDWFQATILDEVFEFDNGTGELVSVRQFDKIVINLFFELFGLKCDDLIFDYKGVNGYNSSYSYKNISIMWNSSRPDMGIHIKMSGSACRDFESLGLDWFVFFHKLNKYHLNYNRVDISIDDFTDKFFTLPKLLKYIKKRSVCSKFRTSINIEKLDLSSSENLGHTIQFGSKASNVQVTFYDKKKERLGENMVLSPTIKFWTRTEVRFRHESAASVIKKILDNNNNVNVIVKGVLTNYIDFKDINSKDSNMYRRNTALWWINFLENVDRLSVSNYLPEDSISKKESWLLKSTSKSSLMVFLSKLDNFNLDIVSRDYILNLFYKGYDKIHYKDLKIVNDFRISNKLAPLSMEEVLDYLSDLHTIIQLDKDFN